MERHIMFMRERKFFCVCVCDCCTACGFLVSPPGIKPWPSAVKACTPNQWTVREFLKERFSIVKCQTIQNKYINQIYFLRISLFCVWETAKSGLILLCYV